LQEIVESFQRRLASTSLTGSHHHTNQLSAVKQLVKADSAILRRAWLDTTSLLSIGNSDGEAARGMAMAKSGVKPLIFLIAVSVMAWLAGVAIHGF